MIQIHQDDSVRTFYDSVASLLYKDEATNSLLLGNCLNLLKLTEPPKEKPRLFRVTEDEALVTAAIQHPLMRGLVLTFGDKRHFASLSQFLFEHQYTFPGVVGPQDTAEMFAKHWCELTGLLPKLQTTQRLYKIESVKMPKGIRGQFVQAASIDTQLVAQWLHEFTMDAIPHEEKTKEHYIEAADSAIKQGFAYFWTVDGTPVSTAHVGRPTKNGISVRAVYTPRTFRKKGFASAVVANLSQHMLDSGYKFCVLYTDLSNPTSNKIYQDVGYRDVSDSKHFVFQNGTTHEEN
jgi:predicted GNAT family acetyltransferase